ncbi:hypothetical protein GQ53DRAFT_346151 [Thozetella sp. PMI_491]|nr:hypothetical protein GQ53DRAFT_346151 [Thozetella sp. PMI_491]
MVALFSLGRRLPRALRLGLVGLVVLFTLIAFFHSGSNRSLYYSRPPFVSRYIWPRNSGPDKNGAQHWRKYAWPTESMFPPRMENAPSRAQENDDLCKGFPTHLLDSVQVVLKTGIGESAKTRASLNSVNSCITNIKIVSDAAEVFPEKNVIVRDILADLDGDAYAIENPDWDAYAPQKQQQTKSKEGWRLDRFKFLPMLERAFREAAPQVDWFVFIETDIYFFWDTLFRMLSQLDPNQEHFLGAPAAGYGGLFFAYGGAGFVLSRALLSRFVTGSGDRDNESKPVALPSVEFMDLVKGDCCGDSVLGYAIANRTGKRLEALFPIFSGSEVRELRAGADNWCVPLLGLHRVQPDQMRQLWEWERTRPYNEDPIYFSTFLYYTHAFLRENGTSNRGAEASKSSTREFWDNYSSLEQPKGSTAHKSAEACRAACAADRRRDGCTQWSFTTAENEAMCRFGTGVHLGAATPDKNIVSGWNVQRMRKMGFDTDPQRGYSTSCSGATWLRPLVR